MKRNSLTKLQRAEFTLSNIQKEILVGLLLGDLNAQKQYCNTRLRFVQSTVHKEYMDDLYEEFKDYCSAEPQIINHKPDKITGKMNSSIRFNTYSLPCFNELYNLFYVEGKKIVPLNIGALLTALVLAYWICDDGTLEKSTNRIVLCTHSFTKEEVELLAKTLNSKWDLKCVVYKHTSGGYIISIPRKSVPILQGLLKDIMPPMMLYKIGL